MEENKKKQPAKRIQFVDIVLERKESNYLKGDVYVHQYDSSLSFDHGMKGFF